MKLRIAALAAAGVLGASAFAAGGLAGPEFKNKYPNESVQPVMDCGDGDTVAYAGPDKLWPPNHKLQAASVTATEGDGDNVALELVDNGATFSGEQGSGGTNHDPDVLYPEGPVAGPSAGEAVVDVQLRAERSGQDRDGRQYVIHWIAEFDNGAKECDSALDPNDELEPFVVTVPHDMRGGADWK